MHRAGNGFAPELLRANRYNDPLRSRGACARRQSCGGPSRSSVRHGGTVHRCFPAEGRRAGNGNGTWQRSSRNGLERLEETGDRRSSDLQRNELPSTPCGRVLALSTSMAQAIGVGGAASPGRSRPRLLLWPRLGRSPLTDPPVCLPPQPRPSGGVRPRGESGADPNLVTKLFESSSGRPGDGTSSNSLKPWPKEPLAIANYRMPKRSGHFDPSRHSPPRCQPGSTRRAGASNALRPSPTLASVGAASTLPGGFSRCIRRRPIGCRESWRNSNDAARCTRGAAGRRAGLKRIPPLRARFIVGAARRQ